MNIYSSDLYLLEVENFVISFELCKGTCLQNSRQVRIHVTYRVICATPLVNGRTTALKRCLWLMRQIFEQFKPSEATFAMFITMLVFYFFWKSNREAASWVFIRVVGIHKPAFYLLLENQEWEGQAIGRNCILCYDGSQQYNKMIVGGRQNRRILNQCY